MSRELNNLGEFENIEKKPNPGLKGRHLTFKLAEVNFIFNLLDSEEMARFIGLFCHFAYWLVFGNINPIQIDF
jgi:hypothetical protein